jgi:DNA polymerase-3 subunit epsilon
MVFVDLETTGGSHFTSRVLEIGIVRVERAQVVARYTSLIHPDTDVPSWITSLTGITTNDVAEAPCFRDAASDVAEILEGAIFVAHNVRFDYSFLKMEFERIGVPFRPQLLCTVKLSRALFPQFRTHKLGDLIERHKLIAPARHRAFDDADCLWQFWRLILSEFDLDTVEAAARKQMAAPSIPSQLDRFQVEELTEGPGVYVFEDGEGSPLYVGKSVNVRRRVMSHFASDLESGAEMKLASQVKSLRSIPTHGELGALMLESSLVKQLQPMYNRQLRQRDRVTLVLEDTTAEGYSSFRISDASVIAAEQGIRILAVYSTTGRAKRSLDALARNFRLCPKLMGLERTKRACFQSQLGRCMGACIGLEVPETYNERFRRAFERQRVAGWPYKDGILIRESRPEMEGASGYVVDNWCLFARLRELSDGSVEREELPNRFDLDTYRIIRRFIENTSNKRAITRLSQEQTRELVGAGLSYS